MLWWNINNEIPAYLRLSENHCILSIAKEKILQIQQKRQSALRQPALHSSPSLFHRLSILFSHLLSSALCPLTSDLLIFFPSTHPNHLYPMKFMSMTSVADFIGAVVLIPKESSLPPGNHPSILLSIHPTIQKSPVPYFLASAFWLLISAFFSPSSLNPEPVEGLIF